MDEIKEYLESIVTKVNGMVVKLYEDELKTHVLVGIDVRWILHPQSLVRRIRHLPN